MSLNNIVMIPSTVLHTNTHYTLIRSGHATQWLTNVATELFSFIYVVCMLIYVFCDLFIRVLYIF